MNRNPESQLTVSMFGELRISVDNLPIPRIPAKAQELFALLVFWNEAPVSRKRLAAALWPDSKQVNSLGLLRSCLLELRKALGRASARLPSEDRTTLRLDLSGATVDVFEFDRFAATETPEARQTALALYRYELLQGWQTTWVMPEREQRAAAHAKLVAPQNGDAECRSTSSNPLSLDSMSFFVAEIKDLLTANGLELQRASRLLAALEERLESYTPPVTVRDDRSNAQSLYTIGVSKHMQGDVEGSRVCFNQALTLARSSGDQDILARVLIQLGRLEIYRHKDAARTYLAECLELRHQQQQSIQQQLVSTLLALGDAAGTNDEAITCYNRALTMAQTIQDMCGIAWANYSLGVRPVHEQEWRSINLDSTLAHFQRAIDGFVAIEDMTGLFGVLDGLALVCHKLGDNPGAERLLAVETRLRTVYSTPRIQNEDVDESTPIVAMRRKSTRAYLEPRQEADVEEAVKIAQEVICSLSQVSG